MIHIFPTSNIDLIESILNEPKLHNKIDGQGSNKKATINPAFVYLIALIDKEVIGMFSIRKITNLVVEGHIRILTKFWGTNIPSEALITAMNYVRDIKGFTKVITSVPGNCIHVLKFMKSQEFNRCGEIHEGIIYNNELTSLIFFEKRV